MRLRLPYKTLHSFSQHRSLSSELILPYGTPEPLHTHLFQICREQCRLIKTHKVFGEMSERELAQASRTCKAIHAQGLKFEFGSKGLLGNGIVGFYAKCGNLGYAEKAFNCLENKDVFAWNSVLSMYSNKGLLDQVLNSFQSMWNCKVLPNEFTFAMVLSACTRLVNIEYGRQVHCSVIKLGLELISFCQGALIDMYAKCNCISDAQQIFESAIELDTVSWTTMISGYVQVGLLEEALKVFKEMQRVGGFVDQVAYVTVINACVGLGRLDDACDLFSQMPNPNDVAWNVMISGHAKRGFEVEAVNFFLQMRKGGVKPTRSTLGSLLSAISSLAALDYGLIVHAIAIKQGLESNVYVGSSLINMYAKCEKIDDATRIFHYLSEKNVVLWNTMLGGYAQNGYAHEVISLFTNMKACGLHPDQFTYTSILSACSCLQNLEMGRQLHSVIIKNQFASNLFVGNALIDMYAKSGNLKEARYQFELIRNRDKVSWNAIIVGYVQEEDEDEAFCMFRRMILHVIVPDEVSLASILSACANVQALKMGWQVHCLSIKIGLETSLYSGSSLIDMYSKCGLIWDSRRVLDLLPHCSVVSMNALISGFVHRNFEEAINIFCEMQDIGLNPSEVTFSSLLDACSGPSMLPLGRQIHNIVLKKGLLFDGDFLGVSLLGMYMNCQSKIDATNLFLEFHKPKNKVLWTAMISGFSQNDCIEEALQFYQDMRSDNALPDQATFASVLRACAVISSLQNGRQIHSLIFHTGFNLDELTCSALVDMYAKCGDVGSSMQVFQEMGTKNGVISWNSMIVGFAKNGYAEDALKIFDEMKQSHVEPDDVTFLGVLTACSHAGKVAEGREIFDSMVNDYFIQPRVDHICCMVDLLGRWGLLKEAEEFIDRLDIIPNSMIWATLLGACKLHGDDIRGRRAAEKLKELEPQSSSPYMLLSSMCAESGNWNEANSLRREMKEKGVIKLPGFSWIFVGQRTNYFSAGDKSHPSAAEIHVALKYLTAIMKGEGYVFDETESLLHEEE
ncbi:PREDICTED: pentatricopeptide repeat-containing protein At3g09040, mitochondrial [Fragaria vesca subsp. vesca]|uniref:pentatricopeptide repeat-containing protein At3g09040, mitochondrial n=1 Tax=Fragaria vesca subsp. vesca TaxID=101020 RepID=UPI0002C34486|nr:PREDICTED: pentatricopeptide repeat-containing protein At3g09040, mitochondrial [Fragaria vesca subsp. vesca]